MPTPTPHTVLVPAPVPLTVAIAVGLMLQVPPEAGSVRLIQLPSQILLLPRIDPGAAVTVISRVTVQPEPSEYVIVTLPVWLPVTIPFSDPTVAVLVEDEVHRPPPGISLSSAVAPAHTVALPVMAPGEGLTVIVLVVTQPAVEV